MRRTFPLAASLFLILFFSAISSTYALVLPSPNLGNFFGVTNDDISVELVGVNSLTEGENAQYQATARSASTFIAHDIQVDLLLGNAFSVVNMASNCQSNANSVHCVVPKLYKFRDEVLEFTLQATGGVCGQTSLNAIAYLDATSNVGTNGSSAISVQVTCHSDDGGDDGGDSNVEETCYDSDGGYAPGVSGYTEWKYNTPTSSRTVTVTDRCEENFTMLREQYCDGTTMKEELVECSNGCNANACLNYEAAPGEEEEEEEDTPRCAGLIPTVFVDDSGIIRGGAYDGRAYDGKLYGTDGDDVILGTDDSDYIRGYDGDDTICAGAGDDEVRGDDGDDVIFGEGGGDEIDGDHGNDTLCGGPDDDRLDGGWESDVLDGDAGSDYLNGGFHADTCAGAERTLLCEEKTSTVSACDAR